MLRSMTLTWAVNNFKGRNVGLSINKQLSVEESDGKFWLMKSISRGLAWQAAVSGHDIISPRETPFRTI